MIKLKFLYILFLFLSTAISRNKKLKGICLILRSSVQDSGFNQLNTPCLTIQAHFYMKFLLKMILDLGYFYMIKYQYKYCDDIVGRTFGSWLKS